MKKTVGQIAAGPCSDRRRAFARLAACCRLVVALGLSSVALSLPADDLLPGASAEDPAYNRPWQVTSFASDAGLTRQRVFDIAFEQDGTVWLAAEDGLRRFDGFQWQIFGTNSGLPSSFIRAVMVARNGELWVGSDKGAGVFDFAGKRYETRGSETNLASPNIRQIVEDPDGTIWFCCDQWPEVSANEGGLTRLGSDGWTTYASGQGLPMNYAIGYFRDSRGRQFAMTAHGWVQRAGPVWGPPQNAGFEADDCVLQMAEGADGSLFAQGQRFLLVLTNDTWRVASSQTVLVTSTRDGRIVAASWESRRGVLQFHFWDGRAFQKASHTVPCSSESRFYRLRQAPDGSIWCVGTGTVLRWSYQSRPWTFYPGLSSPILLDPQGRVWFASESNVVVFDQETLREIPGLRGVYSVEPGGMALGAGNDGVTPLVLAAGASEPQPADCGITTLVQARTDAQGNLWAFGYGPGNTTVFSSYQDGAWRALSPPEIQKKKIGSISADPAKGVWVVLHPVEGVDYELVHAVDGQLHQVDLGPRRPAQMYPTYCVAAGRAWMGSYATLFQQPSGGGWQRVTEFPTLGHSLAMLRDEVLVAFPGSHSEASGCALFSGEGWMARSGNFERAIACDDGRSFLLLGRGGVYLRPNPGTLNLRHLPLPEALIPNQAIRDRIGSFWVGTSEGVFRYLPMDRAPAARVTSSVNAVRSQAGLPVTFEARRRFSVKSAPEAFLFSWRLDEGTWSPFESQSTRVVPLAGLKPGPHRLEARAMDFDGNLDQSGAGLEFTVMAVPLQEQSWFLPLVVAVVLLVAFLAWIGVTRTIQISQSNLALREEIRVRREAESQLQRARDELELRVAERTAELVRANAALTSEIAERKQAEQQRQHLEEQLHQSQKIEAIGTLAGGIAHDFNNILAVIIPYTHLSMLEVADRPQLREDLSRVLAAAERAKHLVQQILTFSRRQRQDLQVLDLRPVVKEIVKLLRSALPSTIELSLDIQPDVPAVRADPTQVHQVLMNLCTNAEYAMRGKPGRLEISLRGAVVTADLAALKPGLKPGSCVLLSVKDNGSGMSEELQQRIFEPFFTTKAPGEGTGLGLAVAHGIVQHHGGAIVLRSQAGVGSEFAVYLPAAAQPAPANTAPLVPGALPKGNGEHILLVDDEPGVCAVTRSVLLKGGYRVTAYHDPAQAWKDLESRPLEFDLVFTDLTMPGMTGVDLARKIHQLRPNLPVVLSTGFGGDWKPEALPAAIVRVLQKPVDITRLAAVVQEVLRSRAKTA